MQSTLPRKYLDPKHRGWSSPGWIFLHSIADSFPSDPSNEDRKWVELLFNGCLPRLLPCSNCNSHLSKLVKNIPIDSSSGEKLSKWLITIHNMVRESTGSTTLTYEEAQKEQEFLRSIKWGAVINDLKTNCNLLCEMNNHVAGACTTPEKHTDFRRINSADVTRIKEKYNYIILFVSLLALIFLISTVVLYVRFKPLYKRPTWKYVE